MNVLDGVGNPIRLLIYRRVLHDGRIDQTGAILASACKRYIREIGFGIVYPAFLVGIVSK